jgi:hypothetical protein
MGVPFRGRSWQFSLCQRNLSSMLNFCSQEASLPLGVLLRSSSELGLFPRKRLLMPPNPFTTALAADQLDWELSRNRPGFQSGPFPLCNIPTGNVEVHGGPFPELVATHRQDIVPIVHDCSPFASAGFCQTNQDCVRPDLSTSQSQTSHHLTVPRR